MSNLNNLTQAINKQTINHYPLLNSNYYFKKSGGVDSVLHFVLYGQTARPYINHPRFSFPLFFLLSANRFCSYRSLIAPIRIKKSLNMSVIKKIGLL